MTFWLWQLPCGIVAWAFAFGVIALVIGFIRSEK